MLERLARWCYHHRTRVLLLWLAALIGFLTLASAAGGAWSASFRLPSTESSRAFDLLEKRFPAQAGDQGKIVFQADRGVRDPSVQAAMTQLFAQVSKEPKVVSIGSPYDTANPQAARQISADGKIAYADIQFTKLPQQQTFPGAKSIKADVDAVHVPGLQVELSGQMFGEFKPPASEGIGVLAAVFILLIAFGSVLAMGLPIITAICGIAIGVALVELLANVMSVPNFASQMAAMIGLGVGIDYALFIVTRYRNAIHDGLEPEGAVVLALTTAGRAVIFAGCTVVISLLGMFFMGISFVRGLAVGASLAVLVTMLATITMLPSLLGFIGLNIDKWSLHRRGHHGSTGTRESMWYRWSRVVQAHPWPPFICALGVLLLLAFPVLSLRMGSTDAGNDPTSSTTRQAYDLLSTGFGPGFNGPFQLAADLGSSGQQGMATLNKLVNQLRTTPDVAQVSPPVPNQAGDAAVIFLTPKSAPQDVATTKLLHHLRKDVIPPAVAGSGVQVHVGAVTAVFSDLADLLGRRLPLFIGAVLLLSFLLLLAVFRSVLVPLKAVIMNLLSIGAAYGIIVALFQWGWFKDIVGVPKAGPIEPWIPMMMFAIVFGLSMDYEVFLLSRMKEEYDRTHDNGLAVADGLASTARVITAAAAIMVCVFASFALGDLRVLKMIGLGLAVAVLIDATIVRMVLVPATMELLGDRNWWFPGWLDRLVPKIAVEAPELHEPERELVHS